VFIVFALLVIGGVFLYLNRADDRYFKAVSSSIRRLGYIPPAQSVSTFAYATGIADADTGSLDLVGPAVATVGQPAHFEAKSEGEAISAAWSVDPDTAGTVDPASGTSTALTASKPGTVVLKAEGKDASGKTLQGAVHVTAIVASDRSGGLPLIGAGYGTVIIAIVAVAAVAVLGLLDILEGEAVATFFGGLLGYIFVKGGQAAGSGQSGGAGTSDTATGSTPSAPPAA
jgi:hypothetical protein